MYFNGQGDAQDHAPAHDRKEGIKTCLFLIYLKIKYSKGASTIISNIPILFVVIILPIHKKTTIINTVSILIPLFS